MISLGVKKILTFEKKLYTLTHMNNKKLHLLLCLLGNNNHLLRG